MAWFEDISPTLVGPWRPRKRNVRRGAHVDLAASPLTAENSFMPQPLSDEAMNSLTEALLQGNKIAAIKIYRQFTGLGLKEAKEGVEELETTLRAKFPEKFTALPKNTSGCLGSAAVLGVGVTLGACWWLGS